MPRRKAISGYLAILAAGAILASAVTIESWRDQILALDQYRQRATTDAATGAQHVSFVLTDIYHDLRTIAALPGVRNIDRHAENLDDTARLTVQQIYNNLASSLQVSEVYIVPKDLEPDMIDPVTGMPEEPIIMFDEMVLNASSGMTARERAVNPSAVKKFPNDGPQEVETFEYQVLREQMRLLAAKYASASRIEGLDLPLLSSPEVITCDNTEFLVTGEDQDRRGIVFSVPFYDVAGKLRGSVSAIVRSNVLRGLLPSDDYALINTASGYVTDLGGAAPHIQQAASYIKSAQPDPRLHFSTLMPVTIGNHDSEWRLWAGFPNSAFTASADVQAISDARNSAYGLITAIVLVALALWHMSQRSFLKEQDDNRRLAVARDKARAAEVEARHMADEVRAVNEGMARLNLELEQNMRKLADAQTLLARKGKLEQLGELTNLVAQEFRGPLNTIRTTAFLLRRKSSLQGAEFGQPLNRIENSVRRCESIITQLQDFGRTTTPDLQRVKLDGWLSRTLEEEAQELPDIVAVDCELGTNDAEVDLDTGRMQRALANLLANAAEALTGKSVEAKGGGRKSILVRTRLHGKALAIDVIDNGPGIAPELVAKVAEPLFSTKPLGTGLGIPATQKILEQHGGCMEYNSQPGNGSVFTMIIPAVSAATLAA